MGLETRTDASQAPIPRLRPFLSLSPFPVLACCHVVVVVVVVLVVVLLLPFCLFVVYYIVNKQKKEGKKEKKTYLGLKTRQTRLEFLWFCCKWLIVREKAKEKKTYLRLETQVPVVCCKW